MQAAQRHESTRQQVCAGRHELRKKGLLSPSAEAIFLPVVIPERQEMVAALEPAVAAPAAPGPIELRRANGRCLRFEAPVDTITLKRLIGAVEAA